MSGERVGFSTEQGSLIPKVLVSVYNTPLFSNHFQEKFMHGLQTLANINRSAAAAKEYLDRNRPQAPVPVAPTRPTVTYQGQVTR